MKRAFKVSEEKLQLALRSVGYTKIKDDGSEWRRKEFHLFIGKRRKAFILKLHEDVFSPYPPFHKARYGGRKIRMEMARIEGELAK